MSVTGKKARKRERRTWRQQDVSIRISLLSIDEMFHIVQRQISLWQGDTADICKNIHWLLLRFSRSMLNLSIDCIKKLSQEIQRIRCKVWFTEVQFCYVNSEAHV